MYKSFMYPTYFIDSVGILVTHSFYIQTHDCITAQQQSFPRNNELMSRIITVKLYILQHTILLSVILHR